MRKIWVTMVLVLTLFGSLFGPLSTYAASTDYSSRQCAEASKAFQIDIMVALFAAHAEGRRGDQPTLVEHAEQAKALADRSLKVTVACFGVGQDVSFPLLQVQPMTATKGVSR